MNFYNDIEPYVCDWAENLIAAGEVPPGRVDRRPIQELAAKDADGYTQAHFFAGVLGWPLALRIAGVPDDFPCWTASLPCQPFSGAGKQMAQEDERHLWPDFYRLASECRPGIIFGEQVPDAIRLGWLDGVFADLEAIGYACGAVVLPAAGIGAPHIRHRIYWMAYAEPVRTGDGTAASQSRSRKWRDGPAISCGLGRLADSRCELRPRPRHSNGLDSPERREPGIDADEDGVLRGLGNATGGRQRIDGSASREGRHASQPNATGGLGFPASQGRQGAQPELLQPEQAKGRLPAGPSLTDPDGGLEHSAGSRRPGSIEGTKGEARDQTRMRLPGDGCAEDGPWSDFRIAQCLDGKARRVGRGVSPLAAGLPRSLGPGSARSDRVRLLAAKANRVGRIRGYGNSIVPQVAAGFIRDAIAAIAAIAETAGAPC